MPGSLTTGVWMGNNNQEPMSNQFSGGLFSADGPLFLWHDFMEVALNQGWAWNDNQPVGQTSFPQPEGIVNASVCRWTGMSATNNCGPTVTLPFLEGTVPPLNNVHPAGCLDLEQYVWTATPSRPPQWVTAADTWSDRVVNGQTGPSGDPANASDDPNVKLAIAPLYGESGFPSVCGERVFRPTPRPDPGDGDGDGDGGGRGGGGGGGGNGGGTAAGTAAAEAAGGTAAAADAWRAARIGPCPPRS